VFAVLVLTSLLLGCAVTVPIGRGGEFGSIRGSVDYVPPFPPNCDIPAGFRK